jgi:hypothetical protein
LHILAKGRILTPTGQTGTEHYALMYLPGRGLKNNGTKCLTNLRFRGTKDTNERAKPKKFYLLCKQIRGFIKVKMGFQNKWIILQPMRLSDEEISRRTRDGV